MPKQQASLLSFFGKGGKKRPANDEDDDGITGNGSASPSSSSSSSSRSPSPRGGAPAAIGRIERTNDRASDDDFRADVTVDDMPDASASAAVVDDDVAASPTAAVVPVDVVDVAESSDADDDSTHPPSPSSSAEDDSIDDGDGGGGEVDDDDGPPRRRNDCDDCDDGYRKSEYELLRERNIARNNARLRELGLLLDVRAPEVRDGTGDGSGVGRARRKTTTTTTTTKNRWREVGERRGTSTNAYPTRRSTRLTGPISGYTDGGGARGITSSSPKGNDDAMESSTTATATAMETEEFTVSPLVEYLISTSENGGGEDGGGNDDAMGTRRDDDDEKMAFSRRFVELGGKRGTRRTLVPCGPRLVPPVGLNAIYSLQFHNTNLDGADDGDLPPWVVGAGKAGIVALWNCSSRKKTVNGSADGGDGDDHDDRGRYLDPVISWKGHGGRWVADARFISPPPPSHSSPLSYDDVGGCSAASSSSSSSVPSRLLTAGNDGTVCHWDLTSTSVRTGAPRLVGQSNKALHASGIFSMDVRVSSSFSYSGDERIVTGSKDKTIAVTTLCRLDDPPLWRSDFHSAKVGSVCFSSSPVNPLIASASDDGLVAVHDARLDGIGGGGGGNAVVVKLEGAHFKPHSAIWMPGSDGIFVTAGLDELIKLWDLRNTASPIASFHGHVPVSCKKLKRIHRPAFLNTTASSSNSSLESYIISGGENSHSISMFQLLLSTDSRDGCPLQSVFSRGKLPMDAGDIGSLAVYGRNVAVAAEGGEVLLLSLS
ncbi:hypothetical protein ACHAXA_011362 [Cyclostephanos tholiformis]|uniref:Uncharacterized protein n=1 Tax=Cyclostephanos tholiformis TaxID=382380 RepID=A0ABD3RAK5_9STRA